LLTPLHFAVFESSTYLPPIASYSGPTSRRISSPHSENNGGEQRPITAARRLRTAKEALKEPKQSRPRLPQSVSEHGLCFAASSATRSFALGALPFIRRALDLDALGLPNRGTPSIVTSRTPTSKLLSESKTSASSADHTPGGRGLFVPGTGNTVRIKLRPREVLVRVSSRWRKVSANREGVRAWPTA
jgi:hypothetical protein